MFMPPSVFCRRDAFFPPVRGRHFPHLSSPSASLEEQSYSRESFAEKERESFHHGERFDHYYDGRQRHGCPADDNDGPPQPSSPHRNNGTCLSDEGTSRIELSAHAKTLRALRLIRVQRMDKDSRVPLLGCFPLWHSYNRRQRRRIHCSAARKCTTRTMIRQLAPSRP